MTKKIGSLSAEGKAELRFDEALFGMIADKLVQPRTIEVICSELTDANASKQRIRLELSQIIRPDTFPDVMKPIHESLMQQMDQYTVLAATNRAVKNFFDYIYSKSWYLIGSIEGRPHLQLGIIYCPLLNLGMYAFKENDPSLN